MFAEYNNFFEHNYINTLFKSYDLLFQIYDELIKISK